MERLAIDPRALFPTADIKSLPEKPLNAHPAHPFPNFLSVIPKLPKEVRQAQDIQQCE